MEAGIFLALTFAAVAGGAVGSFLTTAVVRRGRGESALAGRSRCPSCGRALAPGELVPVVSFLWLRRCRSCGAAIDPLHLVGEAAGALAFALAVLAAPPARWPFAFALAAWLLPLFLFDLREGRLPDRLTLPAAPVLLALSLLQERLPFDPALPPPAPALSGGFAAAGLLALLRALHACVRGREGLGMGDVKLALALGMLLGIGDLPRFLLLAALLGIAHALAAGALRDPTRPVPFGPALCAAAFALWLLRG